MLVLEGAAAPFATMREGMVKLTRHVGSERFDQVLAETVEAIFHCRQMTVFAFRKRTPPRVVSLMANDRMDAVRRAADRYIQSYWQVDPSNLFNRNSVPAGSYVVLMSDGDVDDTDFRRDCYTRTGITHRLSLVADMDGECLKVSFHRSQDAGEFTQRSIDELLDNGDMLASILLRHQELTTRHADDDPDRFERILAAKWPRLTQRERQVCSLIAIGMSSEAIALTLNVSINTVLTFRRRAYARLNISTQNELLRLLFQQQMN